MANGENGWRIERSTISVVTAVGMVCALVPVGWIARDRLAQFEQSQSETLGKVSAIANDVERIEKRMSEKRNEDFKRADMNEWCSAARANNQDFICPDPYMLPAYLRRWGHIRFRQQQK